MTRLDALLLLMSLIWGTNYALVKSAFVELEPQAFNALRLVEASALMVAANMIVRRRHSPEADAPGRADVASIFHTPAPVTRADWIRLAWLGLIGHCLYQFLFVGGLARTSVSNSSLLLATSPVAISLLSTIGGKERTGALHWAGMLLSLFGVYLVVGRAAHATSATFSGDLMMIGSVLCWALYTIGARPLMARHSPVGVTALSMLIGTALYVPLAAPVLARVDWHAVSLVTWAKVVYSSAFAICVAYTIWYAAVRAIGSARTSVYSNLLPIIAMLTAHFWLHEPLGGVKIAGATAVLAGVALTRLGQARLQIPQ